jgi:hypothetical protein
VLWHQGRLLHFDFNWLTVRGIVIFFRSIVTRYITLHLNWCIRLAVMLIYFNDRSTILRRVKLLCILLHPQSHLLSFIKRFSGLWHRVRDVSWVISLNNLGLLWVLRHSLRLLLASNLICNSWFNSLKLFHFPFRWFLLFWLLLNLNLIILLFLSHCV